MSESWPKITVITPSFNQGRFIERTVASVLNQNYPNLEYFVFDGGSTDETPEVLRRYSGPLQWTSEIDNGQAHAVNKGLRAGSGAIIGWLNSDDIYYPGALSTMAARFQADPTVDVIYGRANHIDVSDNVIEAYPTEHWSTARLMETCFLCQPAVFFRRSVVERWGELDEALDYCMDYEYWIRLALAGARFHYDQQVLAGSRFYAGTKTLGARVKVHAEINDMLKSRLGRTPLSWILGYSHVVADDVFGISRSHRKRHLAAMTLMALYSSLRWNRAVTGDLARYLLSATAAALRIRKRA